MLSTLLLFAIGQDAANIERVVQSEMARQDIPGLSILVIKEGRTVLRSAYGVANIELQVPAAPDNVYNAGSIAKTFTALTVMSLVEEGALSLDDAVDKHLDKAPDSWSGITVKHLLTHTSGLQEYVLLPGLGLMDEFTMQDWWEKVSALPLDFPPGKRFAYSNTNYKLLAEVIEAVTKGSYYDIVQERVIAKAGLKNTKYRYTNEIVPRMATGYLEVGAGRIVSPSETRLSAYGAGGVVTNVDDLALLVKACMEGKIVSKETLRTMQTANRTDDGRKTVYGLGWFVRDLSGHPMLSHAGNTAGYSASMAYFPDQNLTVCLMGNVYAFSGDSLAILVARAIEPSLAPETLVEKPDPEPEFSRTLAEVLDSLIAGKPSAQHLDKEYLAQFETGRGRMSLAGFAQYEGYEGFSFLDRRSDEPDTLHIFRIKKNGQSYRAVFTVTKDRKVFGVSMLREVGSPN